MRIHYNSGLTAVALFLATSGSASAQSQRAAVAVPATVAAPGAADRKPFLMHNVMVPMRDGVKLATDIYVPSTDGTTPVPGRYPVLMMRTPYGKTAWAHIPPQIASTSGTITPEQAVRNGYVVVFQDVRGAGDSEGVLQPMMNEGPDGQDTVAWLSHQAWSNGKVGTFGPSYMGGSQMLLAAAGAPGLSAAFAQVEATDQFKNEWVYLDGVLTGTSVQWAAQMAHDNKINLSNAQAAMAASDYASLGITGPVGTNEGALLKIAKSLPIVDAPLVRATPFWANWINNVDNKNYFEPNQMDTKFASISIPILHMGGWYDLFLRNTIGNYVGISTKGKTALARSNQRLIIGPWTHFLCMGCAPNSEVDTTAMQVAWMDRWLKGTPNAYFDDPVVIYVMGENRWRTESAWPLAGTTRKRYYLHSGGNANTAQGDGTLSMQAPGSEHTDRYSYDPRNPAPSNGGPGLYGSPAAQNDAERRQDVLVYSTPVLSEDVEVTGELAATLYAASSATDTDWWVKLIDVKPDGTAAILDQGVVRARYRTSRADPHPLQPGKIERYSINLWATSNVFKKGHRIRVEVSSSNFPYADRNPNAFVKLATATEKDFTVADQTVYHDAEHPSFVDLPVIPASRARHWIDTPFPKASAR